MSLARFKEMLREQYLLVRLDEERALSPRCRNCWAMMLRSARRRSMCCTGSSRRVATCPTKASAGWREIERLFGARPAKSSGGGGRRMPDAGGQSGRARTSKYERLIKAAQAEATHQGGGGASV